MRRAYKFRLYPNKTQTRAMESVLETCRRLYNELVGQRKDAWDRERRSIGFAEQSRWFTLARKENPFYGQLNRQVAQEQIKRVDLAFRAFFRRVQEGGKPGYPHFKGVDYFDSFQFLCYENGVRLTGDRLKCQGIGEIKVNMHRPIEGKIKTVTLKREVGKWYAVFSCDLGDVVIARAIGPEGSITLGQGQFLTASDGEVVPVPGYLESSLAEIRRKSRLLARKVKGGRNRAKAKLSLAKSHAAIRARRRNHHFRVAGGLVSRFGSLAVSGSKIMPIIVHDRPRSRDDRLFNRAVHDAAWAGFAERIKQVGARRGVAVTMEDE